MCAISEMERSLYNLHKKVTTRDKNPVAHSSCYSIMENATRFYRVDRGSNPRDSASPEYNNSQTDSEAEFELLTKRNRRLTLDRQS